MLLEKSCFWLLVRCKRYLNVNHRVAYSVNDQSKENFIQHAFILIHIDVFINKGFNKIIPMTLADLMW